MVDLQLQFEDIILTPYTDAGMYIHHQSQNYTWLVSIHESFSKT